MTEPVDPKSADGNPDGGSGPADIRDQGMTEAVGDGERTVLASTYGTESPDAKTIAGGPAGVAGCLFTAGRVLGSRYRVIRLLGRGGMGEVWQAFDLKLRVTVALKAVRRERFPDTAALDLVRREVLSGREVLSPHVCRIFDLSDVDGQELVSMEYVDGVTLLDLLRERGPLDLREAVTLASQFLSGLEAIHAVGLVHRDVKPENIMVTRAGRVVVMDLGLASRSAARGEIAGTPAYMSPEQARGEEVDARTDVFATGVVLAEMVAPGGITSAGSRESTQVGVREDPPRVPATPWAPVLRRAVSPRREDRFAAVTDLIRSLEEVTLRAEKAEDRSPYPGLSAFTAADAAYFFGRELEVETVLQKLEEQHLVAVVGPSGAGKSSFLGAGVLPVLPEGWRAVVCHPGDAPLTAMVDALAPELAGDAGAGAGLSRAADPDVAVSLFERWRARQGEALLVVDQFEELFTHSPPDVQHQVATLLGRVALEADVHVLVAMRDDFLARCRTFEALAPIFSDLTVLLAPTGTGLRRALVQPALLCGYRFEDEALVEAMLRDVAEERGALPLVAFAVSRLWEARDRERGLLTHDAYEEIGGVGGALAKHAEATLDAIGEEQLPIVREVFRNLMTAQGTRAVCDVGQLLTVFDERERADHVLRALIDARLLTSYEVRSAQGDEARASHRVEVVHESLLRAWPRLVRWRTQDADRAQLRDQLKQAAQVWEERGRPAGLLWSGTSYLEFQAWRARYPGGLTETERAFEQAMVAQAERRQRRRRAGVAGAFAVLVLMLLVVGSLWWQAETARDEAVAQARRAEASRLVAVGRGQLDESPTLALAHAIASLELADSPDARRFALEALWKGPVYLVPTAGWTEPAKRDDWVWAVAFSPDEQWMATGEFESAGGEIRLYPLRGGDPIMLKGMDDGPSSTSQVARLEFGAGSDRLFSWDVRQPEWARIRVWSVPDGALLFERKTPWTESFFPLGLSGAGRDLLTVMETPAGSVVQSWPVSGGEPSTVGRIDQGAVSPLARPINSAGKWLAAAAGTSVLVVELGNLESGSRLRFEHTAPVARVAFSPDGARLASQDASGEVRLWSLEPGDRTPLLTLHGPPDYPNGLHFSPDGTLLVTNCWGGLVTVRDLEAPPAAQPLRFIDFNVNAFGAALDASGRWLAITAQVKGLGGATVCAWPVTRRHPFVLQPAGEAASGVWGIAFDPDGWLVTGDSDGAVRRWALESRPDTEDVEVLVSPLSDPVFRLVTDRTGRWALAGLQRGVNLISLRGNARRKLPGLDGATWAVALSDDGTLAATGGQEIRVYDLETDSVRVLPFGPDRDLPGGPEGVIDLAFASDTRLFSAGNGGLRMWNLEDGTSEFLREEPVVELSVSPDGRELVLVAWGDVNQSAGPVLHYDIESGVVTELPGHGREVSATAFDPTGRLVATGDRVGVVRVGPVTDQEPHLLLGHEGWVRGIVFSPDGRWIASASMDGTARLWPVPDCDRKPLQALPHDELVTRLSALTNVRLARDDTTGDEYRYDVAAFPGWDRVPTW